MRIIDRTSITAPITQTRNGRNIYSHGNASARRPVAAISGIILHQTSFITKSTERMDYVIANFAVMLDGTVLHLRDLGAALNSIGTNQRAIDIEFVGAYPSSQDLRSGGGAHGLPPTAQIRAGRELVKHLKFRHGLTGIFAHCHFTAKNCPGPHLWYNVGVWASALGMSQAGRAVRRIPADWSDPSLSIV